MVLPLRLMPNDAVASQMDCTGETVCLRSGCGLPTFATAGFWPELGRLADQEVHDPVKFWSSCDEASIDEFVERSLERLPGRGQRAAASDIVAKSWV